MGVQNNIEVSQDQINPRNLSGSYESQNRIQSEQEVEPFRELHPARSDERSNVIIQGEEQDEDQEAAQQLYNSISVIDSSNVNQDFNNSLMDQIQQPGGNPADVSDRIILQDPRALQYIDQNENFDSRNILVEGMAEGSDDHRLSSEDQISLAAIQFEHQNQEPIRNHENIVAQAILSGLLMEHIDDEIEHIL